jgi:hypothetical protein
MLWFTALIPERSKANARFATSVVGNLAKRWIGIPNDFPTVDQSSAAYQSGRNLGRSASTVTGIVEVTGGIKIIHTSITAGPPLIALGTCAGGGALSWATGGASVVTVGAGVATGATLTGHGLGVLFSNSANPVNGIGGGNRFRVHNPNEGPEIALGHSGSSPDYPGLERFAGNHGALHKDQWLEGHLIDPREPSHFASWFRQAMNRTKGVHFALDGTGYPDLSDALEDGAKGFGLFRGQYTNVELYNVLSNREWYNKTTFYFEGELVEKANVPFGVP